MEEKKVWGVHTTDDQLFLKTNVIAIGWEKMGDLSTISADRESFKKKFAEVYTEAKPQAVANSAGMLFRFVHEAKIGDYVVYPSKFNREINIGIIEGEYIYVPSNIQYVQTRKVKWLKNQCIRCLDLSKKYIVEGYIPKIPVSEVFKRYEDALKQALELYSDEIGITKD